MSTKHMPQSAVGTRKPRRISKKRKLLFTLICLTLFLVFCEVAVRVRAWIKYGSVQAGEVDDSMMYQADLGITVPRSGYEVKGRNSTIKINSLGFRGEEVSFKKPAGSVRIVCLGASTTYCTGASRNETTWPHQLQEKLRGKYPQVSWEVINAGVPGHCMTESLVNLQHRVLPLQPDLVIFYEVNNQMASDTRKIARERGLVGAEEALVSPVARFFCRHSMLFDLCHKNLRILSGGSDSKTGKLDGLPEDLPGAYVAALEQMNRELKSRQVRFLVSTFLVKYRRDQERSVQIANGDIAFYYMPWMTMDDLLNGIDSYNQAIIGFARDNGVPVVDDVTSIPADRSHFVDCVHLADAGCARMAERFFNYLEETRLVAELCGPAIPSQAK